MLRCMYCPESDHLSPCDMLFAIRLYLAIDVRVVYIVEFCGILRLAALM